MELLKRASKRAGLVSFVCFGVGFVLFCFKCIGLAG